MDLRKSTFLYNPVVFRFYVDLFPGVYTYYYSLFYFIISRSHMSGCCLVPSSEWSSWAPNSYLHGSQPATGAGRFSRHFELTKGGTFVLLARTVPAETVRLETRRSDLREPILGPNLRRRRLRTLRRPEHLRTSGFKCLLRVARRL